MDWLRNQLKNGYFGLNDSGEEIKNPDPYNPSWPGWFQLKEDWKGELHILKMLLNWHKNIPEWVLKEEL